MLVITLHEFGHAITACYAGGRVKSISLNLHEGGVTHTVGVVVLTGQFKMRSLSIQAGSRGSLYI